MTILRYLAVLMCALASATCLAWINPDPSDEPLLDELARIEQQASLVQSAKAEFSVTYLPTTPEERRRIELYYRLQEREYEIDSHIQGKNDTRRRNYRATWFRKGEKEREEQTNLARPANSKTILFDGEVVKTLDNSPFRAEMQIDLPSFQWNNDNRTQPFAFAFEFRALTHGEIIRRSHDRTASRKDDVDGGRSEVLVRHPLEKALVLRLVFDEQHRLLQRDAIVPPPKSNRSWETQPAVRVRHEFWDHKAHDDGHGNIIWFPSTAILRYYVGSLPDGTPVQNYAVQVDIEQISFNVDIPDEKFVLRPPSGAALFDSRASHDASRAAQPY